MAQKDTENKWSATILWRIENFSHWENKPFRIDSSLFAVEALDERQMCMFLYPEGENKNIHLGLRLIEALGYGIDIECSILDSDKSSLITGTLLDQSIQELSSVGLPVYATQEEVFETKKSSFLTNDTLTVQCRVRKKSEGGLTQLEEFYLLSQIKVRESCFQWSIQEFSSIQVGQEVMASADLVLLPDKPEMQLLFLLTGNSLLYSRVEFRITEPYCANGSFMELKVSVLGASQKVMHCLAYQHSFYSDSIWKISTSLLRQELLFLESNCLDNDVLNLDCKIVYVYSVNSITDHDSTPSNLNTEITDEMSTEAQEQVMQLFSKMLTKELSEEASNATFQQNVDQPELSEEASDATFQQNVDQPELSEEASEPLKVLIGEFMFMYKEKMFSDFELRSDGISFPVHKCILNARSPKFRAMFKETNLSESSFLDIANVDAETLKRLLTFLYMGIVEHLQFEDAANLYFAADQYELSSLKQICRSTLRSGMTVSNMCDIMVLADRHTDQELKSIVYDFILSDFDRIMESEEWSSFMLKDPTFAGKEMHQIMQAKYQMSKQ